MQVCPQSDPPPPPHTPTQVPAVARVRACVRAMPVPLVPSAIVSLLVCLARPASLPQPHHS